MIPGFCATITPSPYLFIPRRNNTLPGFTHKELQLLLAYPRHRRTVVQRLNALFHLVTENPR
jgi:hypothetical protein